MVPDMSDPAIKSPTPNTSWPIIGAVIGTMSAFALTLGLSYPLLSLILENLGTPKALIGLNASMTPLGIIVSSPVIPHISRKMGSWGMAMACLMATLIFFAAIGATRRIEIWFVLRFLLGISINGLFVTSETWINQLSHNTNRGRIMGIYATVMALGFCIGPFILPLTGFDGWPPFLVGIACFVAAGLILLPLRRRIPKFKQTAHGSVVHFITLAPLLLMAVLVAAYFDQIVLSFLPLYSLHYGFPQATASYALGILIVGNVFLQIPIGWLADRTSRHWVILSCTVTTLTGCALLPIVIRTPLLLWPMLFVWGGAAFGVYTIALARLGDRYSGEMLLTGSASFGLMWGLGGIAGPALAGAIMQFWDPTVLPLVLGIPFAVFAVMLMFQHLKVHAAPERGTG